MSTLRQTTPSSRLCEVPLAHRFAVYFRVGEAKSNLVDMRFQRVSGIGAQIGTTAMNEGGQNLYAHRLPLRVEYRNLVLERGLAIGSALSAEVIAAMTDLQLKPGNVQVILYSELGDPQASWIFVKAWPVRWVLADLNAGEDRVLIETLELAYARMQAVET